MSRCIIKTMYLESQTTYNLEGVNTTSQGRRASMTTSTFDDTNQQKRLYLHPRTSSFNHGLIELKLCFAIKQLGPSSSQGIASPTSPSSSSTNKSILHYYSMQY